MLVNKKQTVYVILALIVLALIPTLLPGYKTSIATEILIFKKRYFWRTLEYSFQRIEGLNVQITFTNSYPYKTKIIFPSFD